MSIVVVTDSSARLPAAVYEAYGIRQVPLHVINGDLNLREGVDEVPADLLTDPTTTTSGPSPAELAEVYGDALDASDGDGVIAVHMSRRLSGTWASARMAADELGGKVRVVDSRSVGMAVGFAAVAAAKAAAEGADRDRAYEAAIRASATSDSLICVQTLDQLRRSGRISAATRLFGTALSIRPVLAVVDGSLVVRDKQRTFGKATAKMVNATVDAVAARPTVVGVLHSGAPDAADAVADELGRRLGSVTSLLINDIGPVLTSHVGTGAVGVVVCPQMSAITGV
ncbi:DegV family protein [Williamsia sterculiae]|uniref:EDD domain protein, DegV family n=1 Tax=Williamsia sterculiae TaxID=1344003 RepID=A0A1N7G5N2_9NOCA|nr:DegV family protein [Williamsia sterculiae]SIS07858.1 EDD domain protein, DegV family [Williamsia sterculiae]